MYFFFQAEDGIRDGHVTGVQTCALPILTNSHYRSAGSTQPPSGTPPFRSLIWPGTHAERSDPQEAPEPSRSLVLRLRPGPERYRIPVHTDFTEDLCFRENRNRFK